MGYTLDELLQKATSPMTTTDLSAGGLLTTEQADRFIDLVVEESVMVRMARVERMRSPVKEIDKINTSGRVTLGATEGTDPSTRYVPSFTKVTLTAVKYLTPWEVTNESFEDNIEQSNLEDTIIRAMAKARANDLEEVAICGDTGSSDTFLATNYGWRKFAENGHVVSWSGGRISRSNLLTAYNAMPTKWQGMNLHWFFANKVVNDWTQSFADRETAAADVAATSGNAPSFMGAPFVRVPKIPTTEAGTWGYECGPTLSYGFLCDPQNLITGIHREVTLKRDEDIYADKRQYAVTNRWDVEFEEDDAVVLVVNIGLPT